MAEFQREVVITPAYDCIMVQPCVHGSGKCGTVPGRSHGRHNAEMHMRLYTDTSEVVLLVGTGWCLPETPYSAQPPGLAGGRLIEWHSTQPMYEGNSPLSDSGEDCPRKWPTCYIDQTYTPSDEGWRLLVSEGSEAVWPWLESMWAEKFGGGM